jgi:hypothetical protein
MLSPKMWLASVLLILATALAAMVTIQNRRPPPGSSWQGPVDRLASFYEENAGGGSCKWRQRMGAPADTFPTLLLVAILGYPLLFVAAVVFFASLLTEPARSARILSSLGMVSAGLVVFWLHRLDFVRAALELCGE